MKHKLPILYGGGTLWTVYKIVRSCQFHSTQKALQLRQPAQQKQYKTTIKGDDFINPVFATFKEIMLLPIAKCFLNRR